MPSEEAMKKATQCVEKAQQLNHEALFEESSSWEELLSLLLDLALVVKQLQLEVEGGRQQQHEEKPHR